MPMPPRRARRIAPAAVLAAVLLATPALALAGLLGPGRRAPRPRPLPPHQGQFATPCAFSHRAADDPIVHFGMPGMSHVHDFFGNTTTSASSTLQSMLGQSTSCRRSADTAGYWVPTLFLDGAAVTPSKAQIYYLTGRRRPHSIRPFPAGLKIVAGDAMATTPQLPRITRWSCDETAGVMASETPPTCPAGHHLVLHVRFPDCWDGHSTDSADHKAHMAYDRGGRCPADHPVAVPALSLNVHYPTAGGPGVTLASGGVYSGHADFFNTWNQSTLEQLVRRCLRRDRVCGRGS